jgi:hypothetical protein
MPGRMIGDHNRPRALRGPCAQHAVRTLRLTATFGARRAGNLAILTVDTIRHPEIPHAKRFGLTGLCARIG